jgi:DNA-binding response OmpR family regulator
MTAHVLVAEDDAALRLVIQEVLEDEGYTVVTVPNGQAALQHITTNPPAVVLLDLSLPILTGWHLHHWLRRTGVPSRVIFMTGWRWARREAERHGADDYIAKPFNVDDLVAVVRRHL